ncbi:unnamed protein product [Thlaspi arvense]|uniref:Uncharacterized protein n=1 Tax=Thlaspi arvense TaxID=13288 RepID=A0AAU9T391_THLAR|nr:unnamed protein product [Thlaspi arvense]
MEKAILIFIGFVLFSACTQILAESCKENSDCIHLKCVTKVRCVENTCQCIDDKYAFKPLDANCDVAACSDLCKTKGEQAYACILNHCYCRKPPM